MQRGDAAGWLLLLKKTSCDGERAQSEMQPRLEGIASMPSNSEETTGLTQNTCNAVKSMEARRQPTYRSTVVECSPVTVLEHKDGGLEHLHS